MKYIFAVHEEKSSSGYWYITRVRYTNSLDSSDYYECSKNDMIAHINSHPNSVKTKYQDRFGNWIDGEYVRVVDNRYLRTDNNKTPKDNLDNLIKF